MTEAVDILHCPHCESLLVREGTMCLTCEVDSMYQAPWRHEHSAPHRPRTPLMSSDHMWPPDVQVM